jgi:hypothetical protein
MSTTTARTSALLGAAILMAASACRDNAAKTAATDSSLARDLALASSQAAQPTFQDTALSPAPTQAGRAKEEPPAPVKAKAAQKPVTQSPKPTHVAVQPPPAATPAATPVTVAAAPAPAPARAEIGAGTGFALTTGSKVCSSSLPGDKFTATINNAVTGTNGAVIPAGSTVVLEVASATNGENAESAQINLRVKAIVVGDKTYQVDGQVVPEATLVRTKIENADPNADKKKVIGGAIAGAILGQMIGHNTKGTVIGAATGAAAGAVVAKKGEKWEACLPSGAPVRLTLSSPIVVS